MCPPSPSCMSSWYLVDSLPNPGKYQRFEDHQQKFYSYSKGAKVRTAAMRNARHTHTHTHTTNPKLIAYQDKSICPPYGMMQLHAVSTQQPNIDIPFPFSSITCFISPGEFSSLELYATNGGGTAGASFGRSVAPWGRSLTYGGGFGPVFGSFPLGKASVEASWRTLLARSRWNISASRSRDGSLRRFMGPLDFLPCEWSKEAVFQGLLSPIGWKWWNDDFVSASLVQIQKFSYHLGVQEVRIVPIAMCSSAAKSNQAQRTASAPTMEQKCFSSTFIYVSENCEQTWAASKDSLMADRQGTL